MSNKNNSHRVDILYLFIGNIAVTPRKWFADQRLTLHRAFPDLLFAMFEVWYKRYFKEADEDITELFPDLEAFARALSKALNRHEIKHERKDSMSKYCISRYSYKYSFSIRLSKLGMKIYGQVLPGEDAIADISDM